MIETTLHYTLVVHLPSLVIGVGLGVMLAALIALAWTTYARQHRWRASA